LCRPVGSRGKTSLPESASYAWNDWATFRTVGFLVSRAQNNIDSPTCLPHRLGSGPDNHLLKQTGQPLKKFLPVLAIFKNRFAFDSSDDDMMQRTRGVNAGMAEYAFQIRNASPLVNKEATSPSGGNQQYE